MENENKEYQAFVDKFKPKKTTDDCYTPKNIYEVVKNWVAKEYNQDESTFCRPFYPGSDYEHYDYVDKVVVDNPPCKRILHYNHRSKSSYIRKRRKG